jgi:ATP-dependent Lon protease
MSQKKKKPKAKSKKSTTALPLVVVKDIAPLPGLVLPLYISKPTSRAAVHAALSSDSRVLLCLQVGGEERKPSKRNLHPIGGIATILQSVEISNGDYQVDFHVMERATVEGVKTVAGVTRVLIERVPRSKFITLDKETEKVITGVKAKIKLIAEYETTVQEHVQVIDSLYEPGELSDLICSVLSLDAAESQRVLEELDPVNRLNLVADLLQRQIEARAITERIGKQAMAGFEREQHQEFLREQIRLLRAELGENYDHEEELLGLGEQLKKLKMPKAAKKEAEKQLRRLRQLHPDTSEAALARTYIDWIVDLPWSQMSKDQIDLEHAQQILDEEHYGLEKPKDRILDFLGVRKLRSGSKGPILLLVGPPGVGKTSLGKSIARALNRKFVRISLGGLRDEAELRGHRRTYVGAMPGRIVQGLKSAGTKNPLFMLDEIDKIGRDFRGDPSSVLLEVLDPQQNDSFEDHYLNIPFDLSQVMFICTANVTESIPTPLLDRMETIEISGYTSQEKLEISKRYLVPQEMEENGIADIPVKLSDQSLFHIMNGYTRESGVRELRRSISAVFRKVARMVAEGAPPPKVITPKMVQKLCGPVIHIPEKRTGGDEIGIVTGLAWTSVGGELLTVEVAITQGKGQLSLTGQLGEVMRESAMAALTHILSQADRLGFDGGFYDSSNVHIHVPHGGIPKDGPSAGIAIATALASVLCRRPVAHNMAMTGEITLRGSVIPIGGLREKALAALRYGFDTVIIPKANERELAEFPKYLKEQIEFYPVDHIEQVFEKALLEPIDEGTSEQTRVLKRPTVRPSKLIT